MIHKEWNVLINNNAVDPDSLFDFLFFLSFFSSFFLLLSLDDCWYNSASLAIRLKCWWNPFHSHSKWLLKSTLFSLSLFVWRISQLPCFVAPLLIQGWNKLLKGSTLHRHRQCSKNSIFFSSANCNGWLMADSLGKKSLKRAVLPSLPSVPDSAEQLFPYVCILPSVRYFLRLLIQRSGLEGTFWYFLILLIQRSGLEFSWRLDPNQSDVIIKE